MKRVVLQEMFMTHPRVIISASIGRAVARATQHVNNLDAYVDALTHHSATNSHYGRESKKVMRRHDLYQCDVQ